MIRRVHLAKLSVGSVPLNAADAHHVRDVLRLTEGSQLELFDDAGQVAIGIIKHINIANVVVTIEAIQSQAAGNQITVASAIPKGDRADWMIEKLSEIGVARFIPLITERSVVVPGGKNKIERWERIAIEAAKQSRRSGVLSIAPLVTLDEAIAGVSDRAGKGVYLSTAPHALSFAEAAMNDHTLFQNCTLFIGPEGGWSEQEMQKMQAAHYAGLGLTRSILRVETAAVLAAGITAIRSNSSTSSTST